MKNIIAQQLVKMQGEILEKIQEDGLQDIGQTAENLFQIVKTGTRELLQVILEATDQAIYDARAELKASGLKVKQRGVKRRLQTSLGEIRYSRSYYTTQEGEMVYLLDHLIGVESYERVSKALCAKLVNLSAEMSCEKSVRVAEADVSRQTVNNKVNTLREVVKEVERVKQTPEDYNAKFNKMALIMDEINVIVGNATEHGKMQEYMYNWAQAHKDNPEYVGKILRLTSYNTLEARINGHMPFEQWWHISSHLVSFPFPGEK